MEPDECVICLEEYSVLNMPQLLPCSHMICDVCIKYLPSGELECPVCRNPYHKSEITPNNDLIEKIMRSELACFNSLHEQFEKRLEEVVQSEIDKQLKCINQLNQVENEIMRTFSMIRKQLNEAMDFNSLAKHETLLRIKDDINTYTMILKESDSRHKEAAQLVELIEQKYFNKDVGFNMKVFSCEAFQKSLDEITAIAKSQTNVVVQDKQLCLFGKSTVELVYEKPAERRVMTGRVNLYRAQILFNPMDQNLKMFNMKKRVSLSFPHNFIQKESRCIHLHPDTVCVVTPDHILYIDINDMSHYYVNFKKLWIGFSLGRHKGDLAIIGGSRLNSEIPGRDVVCRFKRKEWIDLPPLNNQRMYAAAESLHGKIYVFGGNIDMSIEMFFNNRWRILPVKVQSALSHIVSCSDNDSVYLLGGVCANNEVNRIIYKFDTSNFSMEALDTIQYQLISDCNVSSCWSNNQIFYNIGDDLFQYDLKYLFRTKTLTARKKLMNLLEERIENDFHKYRYDENVELFLKLTGFELEDQAESLYVYLRKSIGKFHLEINFEAQYQMNFSQIEELKISSTKEKIENYADFNVFITNTENNSGIYADCSTCNRILVFNHIVHSDNMSVFKDPAASSKGYLGRELENVKRPFLQTLSQHIKDFGIDEDVLEFVEKYSSDKEYRLYMAWLVKIRDFLYKKKEKD